MDKGTDLDARSRLMSVLEVCEQEMRQLEKVGDPRLSGVLQTMTTLRAEIVAALAALPEPPGNEPGSTQ